MDRWKLARAAGVVVLVGALAQTQWTLRRQRAQLELDQERITALEVRMNQLVEARTKQALAIASPVDDEPAARRGDRDRDRGKGDRGGNGGAGEGGAKPKPSAKARQRTRGNPHADLLERLYDVTDQLAEEEAWDDATYDAVAAVIDDTSTRMEDLLGRVRSKQTPTSQARQEALRIREEAATTLGQILGPDAMSRLKQAWNDDAANR